MTINSLEHIERTKFEDWRFHPQILRNLKGKLNIETALPIQKLVFDLLLTSSEPFNDQKDTSYDIKNDEFHEKSKNICIDAATGSGKTLSYVLPILQNLSCRRVVKLRCLVIVPSRELVFQVQDVFEKCSSGLGIKIGVTSGGRTIENERSYLFGNFAEQRDQQVFYPRKRIVTINTLPSENKLYSEDGVLHDFECRSHIDILICTPGRLVHHKKNTPHLFDHVEIIVVDEIDRLLSQNYQNWLNEFFTEENALAKVIAFRVPNEGTGDDITILPRERKIQKIIASATVSGREDILKVFQQSTFKLIRLGASETRSKPTDDEQDPKFLDDNILLSKELRTPTNLKEKYIVVKMDKPLYLLALLLHFKMEKVIIFCNDLEIASRLCRLLKLIIEDYQTDGFSQFRSDAIGLFISTLSSRARHRIINQFRRDKIQVLVCTDLVSRGIDLPTVKNCINYDLPISSNLYIHRSGRTARADGCGNVWSLVLDGEEQRFLRITKNIKRNSKIEKVQLNSEFLGSLKQIYVSNLRTVFGEVKTSERVSGNRRKLNN